MNDMRSVDKKVVSPKSTKKLLLMFLTPGGSRQHVNFKSPSLSGAAEDDILSPREINFASSDSMSDLDDSALNSDEEIQSGLAGLATPEKLNRFYRAVIDESQKIENADLAASFLEALNLQPLLQDTENLLTFFNLFKADHPVEAKQFAAELIRQAESNPGLKANLIACRENVFSDKPRELNFLFRYATASPSKLRRDASGSASASSATDSDSGEDPKRVLFEDRSPKPFSRSSSSSR